MSSTTVSKLRKASLVMGVGLSLIYMSDCAARTPSHKDSSVETSSLAPSPQSANYIFYEEVLQDTMKALHAYKRGDRRTQELLKKNIPWLLKWEAAPSHRGNDAEMHLYLKRHPEINALFASHHSPHSEEAAGAGEGADPRPPIRP